MAFKGIVYKSISFHGRDVGWFHPRFRPCGLMVALTEIRCMYRPTICNSKHNIRASISLFL